MEFRLPALGEGIDAATVVGVLVKKQLNVVTAPVLRPGAAVAGGAPAGEELRMEVPQPGLE